MPRTAAPPVADPLAPAEAWFASRGWEPFGFQRDVWRAYLAGESGLIHAATGTGKTYAAWLGALLDWIAQNPDASPTAKAPPLRVLWITPLRALAADTEEALRAPLHHRSALPPGFEFAPYKPEPPSDAGPQSPRSALPVRCRARGANLVTS